MRQASASGGHVTAPPRVGVLILNWNGWRDTIECLESVLRLEYPCFEVVVCDNASTDGSLGQIERWAEERGGMPGLTLLPTGGNLGFAGGNNVGLRWLLRDPSVHYLWLLNNDAVAMPGALSALVAQAEGDPAVGMLGSRVLYYDRPDTVQAIAGGRYIAWQGRTTHLGREQPDVGQWTVPLEVDYVTGCSLFVRSEVVRRIGLMDERYFLYAEELDWCLRARADGWLLAYCPESVVRHKEGHSIGPKSEVADFHWTRSTLLLTRKFHPALLPVVMLYLAWRTLLPKILRGQWSRLRAVLRGYAAFLRTGAPRATSTGV